MRADISKCSKSWTRGVSWPPLCGWLRILLPVLYWAEGPRSCSPISEGPRGTQGPSPQGPLGSGVWVDGSTSLAVCSS